MKDDHEESEITGNDRPYILHPLRSLDPMGFLVHFSLVVQVHHPDAGAPLLVQFTSRQDSAPGHVTWLI